MNNTYYGNQQVVAVNHGTVIRNGRVISPIPIPPPVHLPTVPKQVPKQVPTPFAGAVFHGNVHFIPVNNGEINMTSIDGKVVNFEVD